MLLLRIGLVPLTTPDRLRLRFDRREVWRLLRIGVPLTVYAFSLKTYDNLDKIVAAQWLSFEQIGHYSVAFTALVAINFFPQSVGLVLFPRLMGYLGEERAGEVSSRALIQTERVLTQALIPLLGACYFLGPLAIVYLLPQFVPAIPALKLLLFSAFFSAFLLVPSQYLIALGRRWFLVGVTTACAVAYYALTSGGLAWGVFAGWPLEALAAGKVLIYAALYLAVLGTALGMLEDAPPLRRHLAETARPLLGFAVAVLTLDAVLPTRGEGLFLDVGVAGMKLAALLVALVPMLARLERQTRLLALCVETVGGTGIRARLGVGPVPK